MIILVNNIFLEITLIISLAAFFSFIFKILKQPPIVAYILTGIVIGPLALFHLENPDIIRVMGELGVTFLLFMLGLEIKISDLSQVGKVSLITGFSQIFFSSLIAFLLVSKLGFDFLSVVYIAVALTFSSTVIVVKILSDKKDLHSLYGKISIGILLLQDLLAILALMLISAFDKTGGVSIYQIAGVLLKGVIIFSLIIYLSRSVFPKIVEIIARSQEILFLLSLAWVFGLTSFVSSSYIGFPVEIGGFFAGLALANSIANYQIISKVKIFRDFFIVIFFVFLGIQMSFANLDKILIPAVLLSLFVLIIKPLIVIITLGVLGFRKRTSFLTGITLSQISEFSLILVFAGNRVGHISNDTVSLITLVSFITFAASSYMVLNSNKLYMIFGNFLSVFERKNSKTEIVSNDGFENLKDHVVLIGGDQMGQSILTAIEKNHEVVVIDFDPSIVKKLKDKKIHHLFGDIADLDIQERARLDRAKLIVSTIPDVEDNLILIKSLKQNKNAKIVVMALDSHDAKILYKAGADYVILPHLAGGRQIAELLSEGKLNQIANLKRQDLEYLS